MRAVMNAVPTSIPDVCDVEVHSSKGGGEGAAPELLIEVPHGATLESHFQAIRKRLAGALPERLVEFFFVNTDVGAPECAHEIASMVSSATGRSVIVIRSLIPRTLIDCNRSIGDRRDADLNAALPDYIADPSDARLLFDLYRAYQEATREAYDLVCGGGGLALALHSYAPRSIQLDDPDDSEIVDQLHRAYEPEIYALWPVRPLVDVISETEHGSCLAPAGLVTSIVGNFAQIGVSVGRNETYRLHAGTLAAEHAGRYPGQTLCVEIGRAGLVEEFLPFSQMSACPSKIRRMAQPIARALSDALNS